MKPRQQIASSRIEQNTIFQLANQLLPFRKLFYAETAIRFISPPDCKLLKVGYQFIGQLFEFQYKYTL
jgi:hypothetical protein